MAIGKSLDEVLAKLCVVEQDESKTHIYNYIAIQHSPLTIEINQWLEDHDAMEFVRIGDPYKDIELMCLDFQDAPDLGLLFKLRFFNG